MIGGLQGLDHAQQLVEVAAQTQRVVDDGPDHGLGIDDEHRADRLGGVLTRHDHAVLLCDLHRHVVDERERHLDVAHVAERDLVLDGAQPCDVAVETVYRQPDQLGVVGRELFLQRGECHEFTGAHRGEVCRVGEQDDPFADVVGRKADVPLRGACGERRCGVTDSGHSRDGGRCLDGGHECILSTRLPTMDYTLWGI